MADYTPNAFDAEQERQRARFGETRRMTTGDRGEIVPYDPGNPPVAPNREVRPASRGLTPLDIAQAGIDTTCFLYRRFPNTTSLAVGAGVSAGLSPSFVDSQRNGDSLLRFVCGYDPTDLPTPTVPFQDGQCAGVLYDIRYTITGRTGNGSVQTFTNVGNAIGVRLYGPIQGQELVNVSAGRFEHRIVGRNVSGQVQKFNVLSIGGAGLNADWRLQNFTINSVTRVSGSGNCGNPPAGYPVETAPNFDTNISLPRGGNEVPIPYRFPRPTVGRSEPLIEINVGEIPITIDIGGISFGPQGSPSPSPSPSPSNPVRPSPDDSGTDPSEPPPDPPEDDPTLEEPPEQPDRVIRAALVTVTNPGSGATQVAGIAPDPANYFGDLGLIKFRIKADGAATGFTNSIRVQNRRAFIPCPWDGGALEIVGTPRPGVAWTITPVYDVGSLPE